MTRKQEIELFAQAFYEWDQYYHTDSVWSNPDMWSARRVNNEYYCIAEQIEAEWRGLA